MAEGLGSLASGFISGFQMMDGYQRGKKEDARADKLMGLRELESQRDHDYKQWNMKHTEGRAERSDFESNRTHEQGLRQFAADQDYRKQTLSLQQQQESRLARALQIETQNLERVRFQEEHGPLFASIYEKVAAGQPLTSDEVRIATDSRAGKYNISLYGGEALQAGQTALRELDGILKQGAAGELDAMEPRALHQRINSPAIVDSMKVISRGDASKVVGKIDPATGKLITKAEFSDFMPLPPGEDGQHRVAINLAVTYDDGTTERKPVTEGRSADPDDPIKSFTIPTLGNYLGQHTYLSQAVVNSGIQEKLGFTEGPDHKGYKGAAKDYLLESEKAVTRMLGSSAYQNMLPEQQEAALKQVADRRSEGLGSLQSLYGVGGKGGENRFYMQKAEEVQANKIAAGIKEKNGLQGQGWTGATPSLGSAPGLREAMDIPPGDVRIAEKEFINAIARPYLNNATPGNQPADQGRLADAWRNAYPSINR